jgi:hypothetical protein
MICRMFNAIGLYLVLSRIFIVHAQLYVCLAS